MFVLVIVQSIQSTWSNHFHWVTLVDEVCSSKPARKWQGEAAPLFAMTFEILFSSQVSHEGQWRLAKFPQIQISRAFWFWGTCGIVWQKEVVNGNTGLAYIFLAQLHIYLYQVIPWRRVSVNNWEEMSPPAKNSWLATRSSNRVLSVIFHQNCATTTKRMRM